MRRGRRVEHGGAQCGYGEKVPHGGAGHRAGTGSSSRASGQAPRRQFGGADGRGASEGSDHAWRRRRMSQVDSPRRARPARACRAVTCAARCRTDRADRQRHGICHSAPWARGGRGSQTKQLIGTTTEKLPDNGACDGCHRIAAIHRRRTGDPVGTHSGTKRFRKRYQPTESEIQWVGKSFQDNHLEIGTTGFEPATP